ncbi:hypothetical protein B5M09_002552 [Aphanomyces astaci]|uniref:DAAF9 N-terminal domain-containing protein n=1 Tax=Aphanomyces astaci TaxID=112090 RepID=A0A3R7WNG5_APHAT|nr:hypothetical protein B5M09_002552 [Aphanomyces astaci]
MHRTHQLQAFSGQDSYQRLQRLQALCGNKHHDGRGGYEAMLIVGGADGLYSHGSQAALKFLFLGKSGQELLGEQVIPQQYEALEDVVVLITRTAVSIFYVLDSDSAALLLPLLSNWRNVTEYVATDDMTQDLRELTKIRAFRAMVEPHATIGIALHEPKSTGDVPTAEAWPLVQSFGLEDVHPSSAVKGFFSMHHTVVNCSMALMARLTDIDDFFARRLVEDAEPALAHHFGGLLAKLDHAETPAARGALTEADIADDVASFYDFGTIRHDARRLQRAPNRGATVHFGTRTSAEFSTATSSPTITSPQAGVHGQFPATHFTVVAEEPLTGIRVGRTYFVGTGKCAARIVDPDALVSPADSKLDRYESVPTNAADTLKVGRPIGTSVSHAQILVQSEHLHVIEGTLQPYAHGFVLTSAHCPPLVVPFPTHVLALRVLATPHEQLLLVVVDFTEDNNLVRSRMQERLLAVLDVWKATAAAHDIPFVKPNSGYVDPIAVCAAVKHTQHDQAMQLSTVTTVISGVALTLPDSATPFPKLWDQLTPGFVTTVVLTNTQDVANLPRLRLRVDSANPFADVLCLRSNGLDGDLSTFLALDVFETSERRRYRDVHFPLWQQAPSTYVVPLPASVTAVRFEMKLKLDRNRFVACIQALAMDKVSTQLVHSSSSNEEHKGVVPEETIAAIVAQLGTVWTVEASLTFTDDNQHGYTYINTGTKAFLRVQPTLSSPPTSCSFVFTGQHLDAEKLRLLLLQCCPARHAAVVALSDVTVDEKRRIQALHVTDPLPDGYMFDGTSYYDYFGGQYEFHPNIQQFIDADMAKKNDVAARHNNELETDRVRYEECTTLLV